MLLEVLHRASYAQDGQIVHLGAYDKEQIYKATHKSMRRLEQAITTWVKNRVLIRVARGIYQVNPLYFWARRLARYRQFTRNLLLRRLCYRYT